MNIETLALVLAFSFALYSVVFGAYEIMQEN